MNGIQIQLIGAVGAGKTRVGQEIVEMLREKGFAVKWDVSPDFKTESEAKLDGVDRLNALEKVMDKSTIVVKEINAAKDFNASLNYRVEDHMDKK